MRYLTLGEVVELHRFFSPQVMDTSAATDRGVKLPLYAVK